MAKDDKKRIRITGRVIVRKTKQGLSNLRVEAWDKDLIVKDALGAAATDEQGGFVIELAKGQLKDLFADRHVLLFFKVFRDAQLITSTEGSVFWDRDAPDSEIVIKVGIDSLTPPDSGNTFTINGKVRRADGSVFEGGFVQALIAIQGQDRILGEKKADSNGQFEISFTLDVSEVGPLGNLRMVVRVFDSQRIQLAESPWFIPDTTVTVNLTVPNPPLPSAPSPTAPAPPPPSSPPLSPTPPPSPLGETFSVQGQVRRQDGSPIRKAIVRVFLSTPGREIPLGEAQTDAAGNYLITSSDQSLAKPPADSLLEARAFDKAGTPLGAVFSTIQGRSTTINVVVQEPQPTDEQCFVWGRVFQKDGKPLSSGITRLYGVVPSERALKDARFTEVDEGRYRIEYQPQEFSVRKSEDSRVEVRVFRIVDNREQELEQSSPPVRFRADPEQFLDIHLADNYDQPPNLSKKFIVEGHVKKGGLPLGGLTVKAFDGRSPSSAPFGATQSSSDSKDLGHYLITYLVGPPPGDFTSAPNLVIRVYEASTQRGETVLGRPAGEHETMDVIIPAECEFQVDDTLTEGDLTNRVRNAIAGPAVTSATDAIVWEDRGDDVVVHLSTLQIRFVAPAVFAAVDLESDQTGRAPLIVRFVFGNDQDPAGLFAATDEVVRGNSLLSSRWGAIFRDLVWSALVRLSRDHGSERGLSPFQISIGAGGMHFGASESISLTERVTRFINPQSNPPSTDSKG